MLSNRKNKLSHNKYSSRIYIYIFLKYQGMKSYSCKYIQNLNCYRYFLYKILDFPGSSSGKEPDCQCRKCKRGRFDPWMGKILWRRVWQHSQVLLPGDSHEQRSKAGYSHSPLGHTELDRTEAS